MLLQVLDASAMEGWTRELQRHEHVEMTQAEKRCSADTAPVVDFFFWLFFSSLRLSCMLGNADCLGSNAINNLQMPLLLHCLYGI